MALRRSLLPFVAAVTFLSFHEEVRSQDTLRIVSYNLLNYQSSDTSRDVHFRTIAAAAQPDILVVVEMTSQAAVDNFLSNVMNKAGIGTFSAGTFIDGTDTDNAVFYRPGQISFVRNRPIRTALRDVSEFTFFHAASAETLRVFAAHLKASSGSTNETARAAEVDSLRKVTNALAPGSSFIVVGDFNSYSSTEPAYQKLLQVTGGNQGYFKDPISISGVWNNGAYAPYHTQSTRVRAFGGGATGGIDDRFDMILFSQAVNDPGGVTYVPGSFMTIGNDGNHYNDSINRMPNTAVTQAVANALYNGSDHLPVFAKFVFTSGPLPIQLSSFSASVGIKNELVELRWKTLSELNNLGFEVQRSQYERRGYETVSRGLIAGHGTTLVPQEYTFIDGARSGSWYYRLKQIDLDGSFHFTEAVNVIVEGGGDVGIPQEYSLLQNYPNPFNSRTQIRYGLPAGQAGVSSPGVVTLTIYDILGRDVATLLDEEQQAGTHTLEFDAGNLGIGLYYYQLRVATSSGTKFVATRKLLLLK